VTALLEAVAPAVNSENVRNEIFLRKPALGTLAATKAALAIIYHSRLILQDSTSLSRIYYNIFRNLTD
jgi:hypothetical protein